MAARGSRERSSQTTGQPDTIASGSINSGGTGGKGVSLSPTKQLGFGSASSIDLLEISDLVQVEANVNRPEADTICLANPGRGIYQLQFKDGDSDVSSDCSSKSEKSSSSQGPTSVSQVSGFTHESGGIFLSPTQSPSLQTMDRVGGYDESYDPFRIPSAVFKRSSSVTPLEWSIASNESLFSIQVGNNSFSRDHVSRLNELGKSGELTKSGKLKRSEDSFVFSPAPAVIMSREAEMKSAEYEEDPKMEDTIEYNIKDKSGLITDDDLSDRNVPPPAVSWNSSTKSQHSDRSQCSSDSFAFPIEKKCACPLCYRSNRSQRSATVCGHVATLHGQTVVAGTVAGRSAIVGTVAEEVVTFRPLTFWPMKRLGLDPCLRMLNFKALQSLQNQNQKLSVGFPVVHVVVPNGVVHFLLVSNGCVVGVVLVPNGGARVLLVANGDARVLLVSSGIAVRVLVPNGVAVHVFLVPNGVAVHVFLVPIAVAVHVFLVPSGVVVRVLLVANGIYAHFHLVGHAAAVVIVIFVIVAIFVHAVAVDLDVIFTLLVIYAVVAKWTSS